MLPPHLFHRKSSLMDPPIIYPSVSNIDYTLNMFLNSLCMHLSSSGSKSIPKIWLPPEISIQKDISLYHCSDYVTRPCWNQSMVSLFYKNFNIFYLTIHPQLLSKRKIAPEFYLQAIKDFWALLELLVPETNAMPVQ